MELTAANTAIVLDSTADLPDAAARFASWRVVPLYVRFGDESLRDHVDLDAAAFYRRLRSSSVLPTTSQPTTADFLRAYEELAGHDRILSLHIASRFSGTFESAVRAGEELGGGRVRAIDSERASGAVAMLAFAIQRRLERGTTDEEIDELVDRFRRYGGLWFTVETLDYLVRGGRVGRARGAAGNLLNVKPILSIHGGEVDALKRVRGSAKALQELAAAVDGAGEGLRVGFAHGDAPEREAELKRLVLERRPDATVELETWLGPVIGAHAGPGAVGLFWFCDP